MRSPRDPRFPGRAASTGAPSAAPVAAREHSLVATTDRPRQPRRVWGYRLSQKVDRSRFYGSDCQLPQIGARRAAVTRLQATFSRVMESCDSGETLGGYTSGRPGTVRSVVDRQIGPKIEADGRSERYEHGLRQAHQFRNCRFRGSPLVPPVAGSSVLQDDLRRAHAKRCRRCRD